MSNTTTEIETITEPSMEVFRVHAVYHDLPKDKKLEVLRLFKKWVDEEIECELFGPKESKAESGDRSKST